MFKLHNTVRNVFFLIMAVVIAAILYFIFFGATNTVSSETYEVQGGWKGLIGVASDSIEISVSRYYYNYCFDFWNTDIFSGLSAVQHYQR